MYLVYVYVSPFNQQSKDGISAIFTNGFASFACYVAGKLLEFHKNAHMHTICELHIHKYLKQVRMYIREYILYILAYLHAYMTTCLRAMQHVCMHTCDCTMCIWNLYPYIDIYVHIYTHTRTMDHDARVLSMRKPSTLPGGPLREQ